MIWLWVLGRPIEERIGTLRTILFTLVLGISTNTIQYLISGPLFLGYSGVIMGLAGFTWMRGRVAPWEGYPLNRSTAIFLAVFVLAMFSLQMASFLIQLFTDLPFILNIANAAHIGGGIFGALLGRLSFFSLRPRG
jgi:GlpG protein